ncbi:MAG: heme ABC transporter ATP-binding protein [Natronomonas sp.]
MIEFDGVSVELGGTSVLEDISMNIPENQFLAVIGPNGAGKTTLLRTCNGLLSPEEGTVRLDGTNVVSLSARSIGQLVATVPQETHLAFDFNVKDVVAMGRTPHRSRFGTATDDDRTAITSALERTDTAQFSDRSVEQLSGGERQRVVFARALAQETPILLLDEPTASLDINHQIRTLQMARGLADEGKTVVAAIHDIDLAARFCDRLAILADGELLAEGPPETVLTSERLETAFGVRTAVGTNPVTGTATVTPLAGDPPGEYRIHILGGGEPTARSLGRLVDAGIEVTAGVVPEGDVAAATAREVARAVVTAPPFEPVSADRRQSAAELVAKADATVVAGTLDEENRRLARRADHLFALESVSDPPSDAQVAALGTILTVLEGANSVESLPLSE